MNQNWNPVHAFMNICERNITRKNSIHINRKSEFIIWNPITSYATILHKSTKFIISIPFVNINLYIFQSNKSRYKSKRKYYRIHKTNKIFRIDSNLYRVFVFESFKLLNF